MTMTWLDKIKAAMRLSDTDRIQVAWSLASAAYWVVFLWGFWKRGPDVLGANAFVYFLLTGWLFVWTMRRQGVSPQRNWWWLTPLGLIFVSFLIYDNPFLKIISLLLLPVLVALFYNSAFIADQKKAFWGVPFIGAVIVRCLKILGSLGPAGRLHLRLFNTSKNERGIIRRIVLGLVLLLVLAFTVVIPLLSSADVVFAGRVDFILKWVQNLISTVFVTKLLVALLFSVGTLAVLLTWGKKFDFDGGSDGDDGKQIDSVVSGIVLGGILAVYLLFLWVQVGQMWIGRLPFDFQETVYLVKSGFWQLLALSIINIAIYVLTYRKTVPAVQKMLLAFSVASLLLLASAGHRLALYVIYYGFSYEKFCAAYTVLFCGILFVWLISRLLRPHRSDVIKFLAVLFLWMFAVLTVLPVEQCILRSNVALAHLEGSHVRIYELTMLSPDVLGTVKNFQAEGRLEEVNPAYIESERQRLSETGKADGTGSGSNWQPWIQARKAGIESKKWYERTLVDWFSGH